MNVVCKQVRSTLSAAYHVLDGEETLYHAEIPFRLLNRRFVLYKNDDRLYSLSFSYSEYFKNLTRSRVSVNMRPFALWDQSETLVGYVFLKRSRAFWGYRYYVLTLREQSFYIYEIGLGKEGIKLAVFDGENQIALIEKQTVVYDNKDIYEITGVDARAIETAVIFNLYYDFTKFGNQGEVAYKKTEVHYMYTLNKKLREKYDPSFKEKYI